jgi:hypothetical protein
MRDDQIAALRAAAIAANEQGLFAWQALRLNEFRAAASPDAVLSLLDRLAQAERERDALRGLLREARAGLDKHWWTYPDEGADVVARIDAALAGEKA